MYVRLLMAGKALNVPRPLKPQARLGIALVRLDSEALLTKRVQDEMFALGERVCCTLRERPCDVCT